MNTQLTYNQALAIQAEQLDWYLSRRPEESERVRTEIAKRTKPCTTPDVPMSAIEINQLVPRGCEIEFLLGIEQPED
jgi:hypothetical protein